MSIALLAAIALGAAPAAKTTSVPAVAKVAQVRATEVALPPANQGLAETVPTLSPMTSVTLTLPVTEQTPVEQPTATAAPSAATAGPTVSGSVGAPPMSPLPVPNFATSSGSPSLLGLAGGALVILGLAAATFWVQRRRQQGARHIQVVETASLGPKRSLALVVVGKQSLLLSCSESGIFLISNQLATPEMLQSADHAAAGLADEAQREPTLIFDRTPKREATTQPFGGFAVQLAEAEETQGLRRRLSEAGVLR